MIPTPHIEIISKEKVAKTVIMPGDPLRARYIAEHYLEDVVKVNSVRGMLGYTGTYKGQKVTVMGSGMGMPSMGIYSYELFKFYDVDNIIRVGSAGSYTKDLKIYDVVMVEETYTENNFIEVVTGEKTHTIKPSSELNGALEISAARQNIDVKKVKAHCTDVFYRQNFNDYKNVAKKYGCECVEMEAAALFANAKATGKKGAALLTISDCLVTGDSTTSQQRQNSFNKMMEVALGTLENN